MHLEVIKWKVLGLIKFQLMCNVTRFWNIGHKLNSVNWHWRAKMDGEGGVDEIITKMFEYQLQFNNFISLNYQILIYTVHAI